MNHQEAAALAGDIVATFSITPKMRIWIESLLPMEAGTARETYIKLRRNRHERDLSIGVFTDEYRRLRPPPPEREHDCELCGDGWRTVEYESGGRPYRGCVPCVCSLGRENERVWNDVRKHGLVTP